MGATGWAGTVRPSGNYPETIRKLSGNDLEPWAGGPRLVMVVWVGLVWPGCAGPHWAKFLMKKGWSNQAMYTKTNVSLRIV